jgi:riboflavin kinase/FMN adenylyltransferase
MEVVRGVEELPAATSGSAVTIGFFDGVHKGHRSVIGRTVEVARRRGLTPVAVTFDRHPRETLTPGTAPLRLTTLDRKADLIAASGIETLVVLAFTEDFSSWSAEEFVERVLSKGLSARHVVVGSNFTFGHKAMGNLVTLADLGAVEGFTVEGVGLLKVGGRTVSSTSIREALSDGDLAWPSDALGRRFVLDGTVVQGAGRGRTLGFPTANLGVSPRLLVPGDGVYAGRALTGGRVHVAAINIGVNPTFGAEPRHVEAFLLDFEGDLSGDPMSIEFWHRLRDEERFDSAEALSEQIRRDVERTRELMG